MVIIAQDSSNVPRLLLTRDDGELITDTNDNTYHYKTISDDTTGTTGTVWDPAAGKSVHIVSLIVSVLAAGQVEIYDNAAGTTIAFLHFNEKKAVPIPLASNLVLTADHVLGAKWTIAAGEDSCFVTAIGHEH